MGTDYLSGSRPTPGGHLSYSPPWIAPPPPLWPKMAIQRFGRFHPLGRRGSPWRFRRFTPRSTIRLLLLLAFLALLPPLFFHFRLKLLHQSQLRKCGWLSNPPLVCAHGGDSREAVPNTMDAYRIAIQNQVDCIEIDVSRSSDGILFALHDRDLQRMSGNATAKVGHFNKDQIRKLDAGFQFPQRFHNQKVPTVEDALELISKSVKQVILDVKVGPPLFEKGLAVDVLAIINKARCINCLVWSKSDFLGRAVIELTRDVEVGYIVMIDVSTGLRTNLLRMKDAKVVGVYHPLIDEKLVQISHGRSKKVYAWTVDDDLSMQKMLLNRVDAIVTSQPTILQRLMRDLKSQCRGKGDLLP